MDLVFSLMRVHFMFGDFPGIKRDIRKARVCAVPGFARRAPDFRPGAHTRS